ncbi:MULTISPECIES: type II toxin-antitoxin system Phd/YefM family antitoxin [unclassified Candidatus Tisiphia]|uniref:type II toxin-antitoxin system Phd/YefM family antitoxin n=1 Tax=unclassified Candidatus Tisiphia TaxID=2996318 RepID=UPI00312CA926
MYLKYAHIMEAISYTKARSEFSSLMNKVCDDHSPIIITRQKQQSVVVISLDDYNSLEETVYLLKSPKNVERLNRAINDFKEGKNFKKMSL